MKEKLAIIKELIALADENELAELNVEFKGLKVEIRKEEKDSPVQQTIYSAAPAPAPAVLPSETLSEEKKAPAKPSGTPVKSPLAGVFYRAPKPTAPPFVNVGDLVEAGQTLCIVEAMKLMNEIAAETKCKVVQVCKENGDVANEGEILFYVESV